MLVDFHDSCLVATAVTVIGSGENGDNVLVVTPVVAFHNELVCTCNQRQTIVVVKLLRDVLSECVPERVRLGR